MNDGAGKGQRVRPLDTTSLHRSTAGGLSARAAGGKGFGMLGHTGSHGRSMVAKVRRTRCWWDDFNPRVVEIGWGDPDEFPPSGATLQQVTGAVPVVAGQWGGSSNGTEGSPAVWDDPRASVSDHVGWYDNAGDHDPYQWYPSQGIVFLYPFSYPLEVLWTGFSAWAATAAGPFPVPGGYHYGNPNWGMSFILCSTWGMQYGTDPGPYIYVNLTSSVPYYYETLGPPNLELFASSDNPGGFWRWRGDIQYVATDIDFDDAYISARIRIDQTGLHVRVWNTAEAEPREWTAEADYGEGKSIADMVIPDDYASESWPLRGLAWRNTTIQTIAAEGGYAEVCPGWTLLDRVDLIEGCGANAD